MDYQLEVLTIPVADVNLAKEFYVDKLGFLIDVDYGPTPEFRVVQLTPPGSGSSIQFGVGLTDAAPGSARSTYLVVNDIETAHREFGDRQVPVSGIFHKADRANWVGRFNDGADPERTDYASFISFADPDRSEEHTSELQSQR